MHANRCVVFLLCSLLLFAVGCQKEGNTSASSAATTPTPGAANINQPASATPAVSKPSDTACAFITKEEIKAVQKEDVKDLKGSERTENGMIISQCFYTLGNFANSVSLQVTKTDATSAAKRDPKDFWEQTFSKYEGEEAEEREREKEREKEREREKNKEAQKAGERRGESEEEEEGAPPKKIGGIGDEAFWTGNRVGGALYVLKKNSFIRISIGGTGDEATKINKSKALAKKALARL